MGTVSGNDTLIPEEVNLPDGRVTYVTAGHGQTCAVLDGDVWCWGRNQFGQAGQPASDGGIQTPARVNHSTLNNHAVEQIEMGWEHTCALLDNGEVWCWGRNNHGQLGNGTTTHTHIPQRVSGLTGATKLAIGGNSHYMCAIANERAYCWGDNRYGQIGQPTPNRFTTPEQIALGARVVTDVAMGQSGTSGGQAGAHACAVANSRVWCWGSRNHGRLGDGSTTGSGTPQIVSGGQLGTRQVTEVAASDRHACTISQSPASVYCWGENGWGSLGTGYFNTPQTTPREIVRTTIEGWDSSRAHSIIGGGYRTCAIVGIRNFCWGAGGLGQLGNGAATDSHTPVSSSAIDDLVRPLMF